MLHTFNRRIGRSNKSNTEDKTPSAEGIKLPVHQIAAHRHKPRSLLHEEKINELAQTIRTHGMIQPIVVRKTEDDGESYELIAGERRWRAVQLLEWESMPAIIRNMNDAETASVALI